MASHRLPEGPVVARQEIAHEMRRIAAAASAGQGAAAAPAAVPSVQRRRWPSTHRIVVAGRSVMVQHRRAGFAL